MVEFLSQNPDMPSRGELAARRYHSRQFLDVIVAGVSRGLVSTGYDIRQLHSTYVAENSGVGSGFGLENVWSWAEVRSTANKKLLEQADERLSENAVDVEIALALLEEVVFPEKAS